MLEKELEKKCVKAAKQSGWLSFKFTSPQQRGVPDRIFIRSGFVVFVEFKREGEKPRALQLKVIGDMRAEGAIVHIIDNINDFKRIFEC